MTNTGAVETGGRIPSKRVPSSGGSPPPIGEPAVTTVPGIEATVPIRVSALIPLIPAPRSRGPPLRLLALWRVDEVHERQAIQHGLDNVDIRAATVDSLRACLERRDQPSLRAR